MSKTRPWPWWTAAGLVLAAIAVHAADDGPLTTADVVRFLRAGVSERTILAEVQGRGFAEELDAAREAALREAGGSETLVVAVRRVAPGATRYELPPLPASPRPAPSPPPEVSRPSGGLTFGAVARSVRVPVSVLDRNGEPVLGLRADDFRIVEEGRRQPVTYFTGERRPLKLAIALDVSNSMRDKMPEVAEALRRFVDLLEPQDQIMVLTFADDVQVEQEFTSDRAVLEGVFSRIVWGRATALFDGAIAAIGHVAPEPAEGKAVVLVTDGMDTASNAGFGKLIEVARRSEVPVFSIALGGHSGLPMMAPSGGGLPGRWPRPGRPGSGWPGTGGTGRWPGGTGRNSGFGPQATFDARPLLDLAEETGARAEILQGVGGEDIRAGRLKEAAESIAITLRHRYLVGYEPQPGRNGWRKIKVEVARPSVKVQARKGYYTES